MTADSRYLQFDLYAGEILYLQDSLKRCIADEQKLARVFYEQLFASYPQARELFKTAASQQRRMFSTLIEGAAAELRDPDALEPMLRTVGKMHAHLGIRMGELEAGRDPFLVAVKSCIGDVEFGRHQQCWNNLYSMLIGIMNEGRFKG